MSTVTFLTDFADQAVILPVAVSVAIILAAVGWWRGALTWLLMVGITFGTVLVLKLGFLACGPVFGPWLLRSPSGHTAAASLVAGGLAMLLSGRKLAVLPVALLAAVVIGISRVLLGFHSVPEVLLGAVVGIVGAMVLSRVAGPPPIRRPVPVLLVVAVVALVFHGVHLPAEAAIRRNATGVLNFVPACRDDAFREPVCAGSGSCRPGAG
jgi:membrane-associated phospholipid phosphatase